MDDSLIKKFLSDDSPIRQSANILQKKSITFNF